MDHRPALRDHPVVVASILGTAVASGAYEIVPASTTPVLSAQLGASAAEVSWLVSVMLGVAVVASLPAGAVVDRFGAPRSFAFATAVFLVGGAASWQFTQQGAYWPVLWSRVVAGLGFVLLWNTGLTVFGQFRNAATATGLFTASGPIGFAVGHLTGPTIVAEYGAASVFLVYPLFLLPALAGILLGWEADLSGGGTGKIPALGDVLAVARNRAVLLVCVLGFVAYSLYLFVNSWVPTYLTSELGLSLAQSGALTAMFPLLGAGARASGGVVTDRLFGGRARPVVLASLVVSGVTLVGIALSETYLVVAAFLLVGGYFVQLSLGLFYGVVPRTVSDDSVTTAVALLTSLGLFGAFSAPLIAGEVIQATGSYAAAFGYALALTVVGFALAVPYFHD
ncbi:MFS transporter [Halobacterium sp. KA-6]|jgi:nitrate/nitrite transporter NarK|uniref:MFS transporter n=1 Tax=Halobacterium sp. KA-6 TaxID=2896368 RepID=UPI001E405B2F|nr:MFS transporter [Halobacterium sp. KA-6]MCD2202557.1 MFS transporter [Halobacterium sp. KA-6]